MKTVKSLFRNVDIGHTVQNVVALFPLYLSILKVCYALVNYIKKKDIHILSVLQICAILLRETIFKIGFVDKFQYIKIFNSILQSCVFSKSNVLSRRLQLSLQCSAKSKKKRSERNTLQK